MAAPRPSDSRDLLIEYLEDDLTETRAALVEAMRDRAGFQSLAHVAVARVAALTQETDRLRGSVQRLQTELREILCVADDEAA